MKEGRSCTALALVRKPLGPHWLFSGDWLETWTKIVAQSFRNRHHASALLADMWRRNFRLAAASVRQLSTRTAFARSREPETLSIGGRNDVVQSCASSRSGKDTLGRRLFALVYAKRSAVVAIGKWKEEGHIVKKYELNRIVRDLRRIKRHKHALEVCEWMRVQEDLKLVPGDYALHLDLIAKIRGLNSAEKFFEDLPEKMRDSATCSALLHTYVQHNEAEKAEALMEKMAECGFLRSPLPFNHMLSLYVSTGLLEKVPGVVKDLKKTTSPDVVTYNLLLAACTSESHVGTADKVYAEMGKAKVEPDWVTYSTLASIYTKNSLREKAESALKAMEKNVSKKVRVPYASLISLHTGLENRNEVQRIWKKMKSVYRKLTDAEYTCMITSMLKLKQREEAQKLYDEWESISPTKDSRVPNLLIAAYINNNEMETAETFYNRVVKKEIKPCYTTWELFTWGYLKQKQLRKSIDSFKNAVRCVRRWDPDEELVAAVFKLVEENGNVDAAEQLLETLRRAGYVNTEVYKSLLRTYSNAGKMPLIVEERMKKDNLEMDEETRRLVQETSKMCVTEIPSNL